MLSIHAAISPRSFCDFAFVACVFHCLPELLPRAGTALNQEICLLSGWHGPIPTWQDADPRRWQVHGGSSPCSMPERSAPHSSHRDRAEEKSFEDIGAKLAPRKVRNLPTEGFTHTCHGVGSPSPQRVL
eukprot:scaffold598_cov318-Pavlova_lutheri.AAC.36